MRKTGFVSMLLLAAFLASALLSSGSALFLSEQYDGLFRLKHDKAKRLWLWTKCNEGQLKLLDAKGKKSDLVFSMFAVFPEKGETGAPPDFAAFTFFNDGGFNLKYESDHAIEMKVDGKPFPCKTFYEVNLDTPEGSASNWFPPLHVSEKDYNKNKLSHETLLKNYYGRKETDEDWEEKSQLSYEYMRVELKPAEFLKLSKAKSILIRVNGETFEFGPKHLEVLAQAAAQKKPSPKY